MNTSTMIHHLAASDPAAELFRQALGLEAVASLTVIATTQTAAQSLLIEVWDPMRPGRPEKRYLYTEKGRLGAAGASEPVAAMMPHKAEQLACLLSHPEIKITVIDAEAAIEIYTDLEQRNPSRETLRNGRPRQYLPPVLD